VGNHNPLISIGNVAIAKQTATSNGSRGNDDEPGRGLRPSHPGLIMASRAYTPGRGSCAKAGEIEVTFAGRVAGVLGTRLIQLGSTIAVSFLLARLLGPDGRGIYAVLILLPTTLFAFGQLGLTSAMTFYAGRGVRLADLERHALGLAIGVSAVVIGAALLALPVLEQNVLRVAPDDLLRLALLALPLRLVATLGGSVLYGRQRYGAYNLILGGQSIIGVVLVVAIVGVLDAGVPGAVAAYLLFLAIGTLAVVAYLDRTRRATASESGLALSAGELLGYGLRLYPASLGTFFGYRADVFLLGWLLGSPTEIGTYAVAVSLAELVFNVPDAVSTVLFPRIASASREEADRLAPAMARATIIVTSVAALALIPAAWLALTLLLPAFVGGMPALVILLPGIVSLSLAKILTSYLSGIERLAPVTTAAVTSLVVNLGANLALIPVWGIVGAAAASLLSYTVYAVVMVRAASQTSGAPWHSFVVPRAEDAARVGAGLRRLVGAASPSGRRTG
jgi:O-antigen/teichoic acid export membrane protein